MSRVLYLDTLEEVRIMTDPYRVKIMTIFSKSDTPLTVKDVANSLDEPHGKVYYHIKKMLNIGALEVVDTKQYNCFVAKYMALTFDEMKINPEFQKESDDSMTTVVSDMFDNLKDKVIKQTKIENVENEVDKYIALVNATMYFDEDSYKEFTKEMQEIIKKYSNKDKDMIEKKMFYTIYSDYE